MPVRDRSAGGRRHGRRLRRPGVIAMIALLVLADQLSKALAPQAAVLLDPGTSRWMPAALDRLLRAPVSGTVCDTVGCLLALSLAAAATRLRGVLAPTGVVVVLAGFGSNLLDRLGLAALTQDAPVRSVVNWFHVGLGRFEFGNPADCYIATGAALLALAGMLAGRPVLAGLLRRARLPHWCATTAAAGLLVLGGGLGLFAWSGYWPGPLVAAARGLRAAVVGPSRSVGLPGAAGHGLASAPVRSAG